MSVSVTLEASPSHSLVLSHYAPGEECRPHRHDRAQLSLLLAGGYEEDSERGRACTGGPSLSRKPAGFEHQNRFGDAGALMLSINVDAVPEADQYFLIPRPAGLDGKAALRRMANDGSAMAVLANGASPNVASSRALAGPWLVEAHDRLLADSGLGIGTLARTLGLHPVRFARLFREAFALSPTAVRQNHRAAQAVGQLIRTGTPLADIALSEGFADQAHFSRSITRTTGWSPGRLRRLFAAT